MAAIELDDVTLTFQVWQNKHMSLKEFLLKALLRKHVTKPVSAVTALRNIIVSPLSAASKRPPLRTASTRSA